MSEDPNNEDYIIMNGRGGDALPVATSRRWQPIRSGLFNIYRFDDEEFHFEQGRLLLRGNNGTGKSRVLALQLPFLLDGEAASHRLEPDGETAKRMEWNLLLDKHTDRLGYTWLEFGRQDEEGREQYFTLGCGLLATEGRGLVGKWFFTTKQRIGVDLLLQTNSGHALTKDRLAEAIDAEGAVFTSATAYRQAVDQTLFKLGKQRYDALVDLLIELRKPQLARKLDEQKLSAALSGALPPVSPSILADVAESFRSLQSDRDALEALHAARQAVEGFLEEYCRYCQIAARRRAAAVRQRHSDYEATMRRLRAAEAEQTAAQGQLVESDQRINHLTLEETSADAAVDALEQSPAMRDARELDQTRRRAEQRQAEAERAKQDWRRAIEAHQQCEWLRQLEEQNAAAAWDAVEAAVKTTTDCAKVVGLGEPHGNVIETLGMPEQVNLAAVPAGERSLKDVSQRRRDALRHIRKLNERVEQCNAALVNAKGVNADIAVQVDSALEEQREAHAKLQRTATALSESYREWVQGLTELAPMAFEDIAPSLTDWCESGEGLNPIASAIQAALADATNRLAALQADCGSRLEAADAQWRELCEAHRQLLAGRHEPPPRPYTRDESVRADRSGAPLWLLCDFAADVPVEAQIGIESAMEASGILDAWVTPEGRLLDVRQHDTILVVGSSPLPPESSHLGRILAPAIDRDDPCAATVGDAVVADILRHIGLGSQTGSIWVDVNGRWQLGPMHGTWFKPAVQHVGQAARDADRRRRLESLDCEIAEVEKLRERLRAELETLERRANTTHQEADRAPTDGEVRSALAEVGARTKIVDEARGRLSEAEARVARCRRELSTATEHRDQDARDLRLTEWVDRLQELEDGIADYLHSLAELWPAIRSLVMIRGHAMAAKQREAESKEEQSRRAELFRDAEKLAVDEAARRNTLEAAVGATAKEVIARLEQARGHRQAVRGMIVEANKNHEKASNRLAVASRDIETHTATMRQEAVDRDLAIQTLKKFAGTRLLAVAVAELGQEDADSWSVTRAVEVARRIEQVLEDVASDDAAWERNQGGIYRHIQELTQSLLHYDYHPMSTMEDDIFVVSVPFQGRDCTMIELRDILSEEVAQHQLVLGAREREILENHLVGEVAMHLHDLLRAAELLIREMNDELKTRPMSTGMTLRFTWEPIVNGPVGLVEARKRLLAAGGTWSSEDRESLGNFLQQQIQAVRAVNAAGTWQEHLMTAMDYRTWHQFGIERLQDGRWVRLTRRTHGTGSGGEKAVALTIPQFAAAAAHYRTADPLAPRFILLDEAFVGVDKDMRSKCMDLLRTFDLDVIMTSENEWGCYPTVPGLAIYQLASRPGFDAVAVTRWVWNGRQLVRRETKATSPAPPEKALDADHEQDRP